MAMETVASNVWQRSKLLVKAILIGALVLLLLIPAYFVQGLISEREARQKEAFNEISSKWAGKQIVTGPVVVIPFWKTETDGTIQRARTKHFSYFLPDNLQINSNVSPQEKYRGIYKVMLYNSRIHLSGSFGEILPTQLGIRPDDMIWNEAFVKLHVSDFKGLNDEVKLKWKDSSLVLIPAVVDDKASMAKLERVTEDN